MHRAECVGKAMMKASPSFIPLFLSSFSALDSERASEISKLAPSSAAPEDFLRTS